VTRRYDGTGLGELLVDGRSAGSMAPTRNRFFVTISWSALDAVLDRGSPVGDYPAPFAFTGSLRRVVVDLVDDQDLDHRAAGEAELGRE